MIGEAEGAGALHGRLHGKTLQSGEPELQNGAASSRSREPLQLKEVGARSNVLTAESYLDVILTACAWFRVGTICCVAALLEI
jgi:hypothetical protein